MLLAGDIGGTKTMLAVYAPEQGACAPLIQKRFPSDDYDSLEAIIADFLRSLDQEPTLTHAAFGIAGPVVNGRVQTTNLPWVIDEQRLKQRFHLARVRLLNDLEAVALAVPNLDPGDMETLKPGRATPGGTIAVIAPGTGLGEAFLVWDGHQYRAYPSEGGHTDFGPTSELEIALLQFLHREMGMEHVSYEQVCSGLGIPNLYAFLKHHYQASEPDWLATELALAEDQTPVIVAAANDPVRANSLCQQTVRLFISILGSEAGNLALKLLATGGVYIGGGIPPRILPHLQDGTFLTAFSNKGRFRRLLEDVPVSVITHHQAALLGAASFGLAMMTG